MVQPSSLQSRIARRSSAGGPPYQRGPPPRPRSPPRMGRYEYPPPRDYPPPRSAGPLFGPGSRREALRDDHRNHREPPLPRSRPHDRRPSGPRTAPPGANFVTKDTQDKVAAQPIVEGNSSDESDEDEDEDLQVEAALLGRPIPPLPARQSQQQPAPRPSQGVVISPPKPSEEGEVLAQDPRLQGRPTGSLLQRLHDAPPGKNRQRSNERALERPGSTEVTQRHSRVDTADRGGEGPGPVRTAPMRSTYEPYSIPATSGYSRRGHEDRPLPGTVTESRNSSITSLDSLPQNRSDDTANRSREKVQPPSASAQVSLSSRLGLASDQAAPASDLANRLSGSTPVTVPPEKALFERMGWVSAGPPQQQQRQQQAPLEKRLAAGTGPSPTSTYSRPLVDRTGPLPPGPPARDGPYRRRSVSRSPPPPRRPQRREPPSPPSRYERGRPRSRSPPPLRRPRAYSRTPPPPLAKRLRSRSRSRSPATTRPRRRSPSPSRQVPPRRPSLPSRRSESPAPPRRPVTPPALRRRMSPSTKRSSLSRSPPPRRAPSTKSSMDEKTGRSGPLPTAVPPSETSARPTPSPSVVTTSTFPPPIGTPSRPGQTSLQPVQTLPRAMPVPSQLAGLTPQPPPPKLSLLVRDLPKLPLTAEEVFLHIHSNLSAPAVAAASLALARLPGGSISGELTFDDPKDTHIFKQLAPKKWPSDWGYQPKDIEYLVVNRDKAFWPPDREVFENPRRFNGSNDIHQPDNRSPAGKGTASMMTDYRCVLLSDLADMMNMAAVQNVFVHPQRRADLQPFEPKRITFGRLADVDSIGCLLEFEDAAAASACQRAVSAEPPFQPMQASLSASSTNLFTGSPAASDTVKFNKHQPSPLDVKRLNTHPPLPTLAASPSTPTSAFSSSTLSASAQPFAPALTACPSNGIGASANMSPSIAIGHSRSSQSTSASELERGLREQLVARKVHGLG